MWSGDANGQIQDTAKGKWSHLVAIYGNSVNDVHMFLKCESHKNVQVIFHPKTIRKKYEIIFAQQNRSLF